MINASEFTLEQRAELQARIDARLAELRAAIAREAPEAGRVDALNLTTQAHDSGDDAVADLEESLGIAELERDLAEARALEAARERLRTPGYGVCADCSLAIPFARLQASPAATRCIECQARFERSHAGPGAPRL